MSLSKMYCHSIIVQYIALLYFNADRLMIHLIMILFNNGLTGLEQHEGE